MSHDEAVVVVGGGGGGGERVTTSVVVESSSEAFLEELLMERKRIEDPKLLRKISSPLLQYVESVHKDLRPLKAIKLLNSFLENLEFHRSSEKTKREGISEEEFEKLVRDIEKLLEDKSVYIDRLKQEYDDIQAFLAECRVPDSGLTDILPRWLETY